MELGESASAGAQRETEEESGASVRMGQLFSLLSVPRVGQVHLFYLAPLQNENFAPDPNETLAVRLLAEADIDWHSIAFTTVRLSLQAFFADFKTGSFGLHTQDVV